MKTVLFCLVVASAFALPPAQRNDPAAFLAKYPSQGELSGRFEVLAWRSMTISAAVRSRPGPDSYVKAIGAAVDATKLGNTVGEALVAKALAAYADEEDTLQTLATVPDAKGIVKPKLASVDACREALIQVLEAGSVKGEIPECLQVP